MNKKAFYNCCGAQVLTGIPEPLASFSKEKREEFENELIKELKSLTDTSGVSITYLTEDNKPNLGPILEKAGWKLVSSSCTADFKVKSPLMPDVPQMYTYLYVFEKYPLNK